MKKNQQNSISTGVSYAPQCANSAPTTPSRFASHPFSKPPRPSGTLPLKRRGILLFCFLLSPFSSMAQLTWNAGSTYTIANGEIISQNITLTGTGTVWLTVPSGGTATISGKISGGSSTFLCIGNSAGSPGSQCKLILTGANDYQGKTFVNNKTTLQVGNGTSGSINNTSNVELNGTTAILRFEPAATMTFHQRIISGTGSVEIKGKGIDNGNAVYFNSNNTYTGTTTIEQGILWFGSGSSSYEGSVAGDIMVNQNAFVGFGRGDNWSYSKKISGAGGVKVCQWNNTAITFGGVNTYTGPTEISRGELILNAAGTIATSSGVIFEGGDTKKFNISAGNKTIKQINSAFTTAEILLGDKRLTIGTDGGNDGGGNYAGKISGTGWIDKYGTGTLTLTGASTYTGDTWIYQGTVVFSALNNFGTGNIMFHDGTKTLKWAAGNTADISGRIGFAYNSSSTNVILDVGSNNVTFASNFTSVLSTGKITKAGTGKLTITANNTCASNIVVSAGTLQIGNGTTGTINNTAGVSISNGAILRFEPGGPYNFTKKITGAGKVEYKGSSYIELSADNDYTGTTTIEQGTLYVGAGGATGKIVGNIIVNADATVSFDHNVDHTYAGVISGEGNVGNYYRPTGILTLSGANTYSGITSIHSSLALTGTIANSSHVYLNGSTIKLDVSSGDKKIKALIAGNGAEVILGSKTLTVESGDFSGKFSGIGGVIKNGSGTLTLTGTQSATGLFSIEGGKVDLSGSWAGSVSQSFGTGLDIKGNVTFSGTFTLLGGEISMNLIDTPPSKITVSGKVFEIGNTKLNIASGVVNNQAIMQAQSGIDDISKYTLNMPGFTANLATTGSMLILTATVTDDTPPVPGTGINGTADINSANLSWSPATDDATLPENLRYFVYQSTSNNITSVAQCETNGTLLNTGGTVNITDYTVLGLTPNTTYFFNVVVADQAGNKAAYNPKELTTQNEPKVVSVTISPKTATVSQGETKQFSATVVAIGGADEEVIWSVTEFTSALTTINQDGLLFVGSNEIAKTIIVKAVSRFDPTVFDEVEITIGNVGIASAELSNQITVYPNPTSDVLRVTSEGLQVISVEVFDMMGKKQKSRKAEEQNGEMVLDVSDFPAGVYFLRISTEKGVVTKKVIKQ